MNILTHATTDDMDILNKVPPICKLIMWLLYPVNWNELPSLNFLTMLICILTFKIHSTMGFFP
jgi:hypothetical protein